MSVAVDEWPYKYGTALRRSGKNGRASQMWADTDANTGARRVIAGRYSEQGTPAAEIPITR